MGYVSRSGFLKNAIAGGVVAAGASVVTRPAHAARDAGPPPVPDFFGIVTNVERQQLTVRPPHTTQAARAEWKLRATPGAVVWRLRRSRLAAFQPGEQVLAFGDWLDSTTFKAVEVTIPIDAVEGTVLAQDGHTVLTDAGRLDLDEAAPGAAPSVRPGDRVSASVLQNVDTGVNYVFRLSVLHSSA
jgi:hypothetical protein